MTKSERTKELERMLHESKEQDYADSKSEREAEEAEKRAKEEARRAKESARIQELKNRFSWTTEGELSWVAIDLEAQGYVTMHSYFRDHQNESIELTKDEWESLKHYTSGLH